MDEKQELIVEPLKENAEQNKEIESLRSQLETMTTERNIKRDRYDEEVVANKSLRSDNFNLGREVDNLVIEAGEEKDRGDKWKLMAKKMRNRVDQKFWTDFPEAAQWFEEE